MKLNFKVKTIKKVGRGEEEEGGEGEEKGGESIFAENIQG